MLKGGVNGENKFASRAPSDRDGIGENSVLPSIIIAGTNIDLDGAGHFLGIVVVGRSVAGDEPGETETTATTLALVFFFPFFVEVGIGDALFATVFGGIFPEFFIGGIGANTEDGTAVGVVLVSNWNSDGINGKTHAFGDGAHVDFNAGARANSDRNIIFFFHGVLLDNEAEHGLANDVIAFIVNDDFDAGIRKEFGSVKMTVFRGGFADKFGIAVFSDVA